MLSIVCTERSRDRNLPDSEAGDVLVIEHYNQRC